MKLISLNIWGGKLLDPLLQFFKEEAKSTDIFCLQEVIFGTEPRITPNGAHEDVGTRIQNILQDFFMYEALAPKGTKFVYDELAEGVRVGQAMFVRKTLQPLLHGSFETYPERSDIHKLTGRLQYIEFKRDGNYYIPANLHGIWQPSGKGDTPERFRQVDMIRSFFDGKIGKKILAGDFNVSPKSECIKLLGNGMRNLIREYDIRTTRSRFYEDMEKYQDYISDYVFISPDVNVDAFQVLDVPISDHFPVVLEFS